MIKVLSDNVLLEIFDLCRMDEVATSSLLPWKWHRLAHVCRTWRGIIFASSHYLNLELLCTYGTPPVRTNLGHLPALPIVIHFPGYIEDSDEDNIIATLEHPDRVHVLKLTVSGSLLKKVATMTQKPFPALTHLRLESKDEPMPVLPDAFLGGCAPRLQRIYLNGVLFPAAPTLLLSAPDLIDINLRDIAEGGYISPEAMVACLAVLPRLKYLTFGFQCETSYPNLVRLPPITRRAVLPALTRFHFNGLCKYLEDFVVQIDAPQLNRLGIGYEDEDDEDISFQIPQLCKFVDRSEKLKLSRFRHADLGITPRATVIGLWGQSSLFTLSTRGGISQVLSQISGMLPSVGVLSICAYREYGEFGDDLQWLELLRPFTAVKALSVQAKLSRSVALALKDVTGARAAEVLPALELLCLKNRSVTHVKEFVAARRNMGRPVTFVDKIRKFQERLEPGVVE
ncbi:hypothetical protein EDB89DRAFT_1375053 [Lactarius sanguifluus]|nr:hypothetical protein EDB89DRAFT_849265 [Lactarius sanguifluus]KAH9169836.1 hypothetical protein EDB89DRAFT_1375053 [Lactarius sanguifluus]